MHSPLGLGPLVPSLPQVIASVDVLFQPHFNLQRVVEHALIRGKDTVVFHRPPPGGDLTPLALLHLDDASLGVDNPRVLAAEPSPSGGAPADGISSIALAPLLVLRKTSIADVFPKGAAPASVSGPTHASSQTKQLASLIQQRLIASGKPVYALEEEFCVDVSTAGGVEGAGVLVSALEQAMVRHQTESAGAGPAVQALMEVTQVSWILVHLTLLCPSLVTRSSGTLLPTLTKGKASMLSVENQNLQTL